MALKELLGDLYKEGMTLAEVETALATKKLVDLSMGEYISKSKFVALEKEYGDFKTSKMTDDEKRAAAELEKENRIKLLEKQNATFSLEKTLLGKGFTSEETAKLIEKAEDTKAYSEVFADIMQNRLTEAGKKAQAQIVKSATNIPGGATVTESLSEKDKLLVQYEDANKNGRTIDAIAIGRQIAELNAKETQK